uniref:Uncharacterized protein n=1 Tax=Levilinea saccharolytica TaxID=229921 RepID=A0A0M9U2W3_9CHLR|nr:hypothetical protein LSAC_03035 [Levilinea saccharolytica]
MRHGRHESDGRLQRAGDGGGGGAASGVQRYSTFGEVRSRGGEMPTAYQYTGQLSQMEQVGLYHYGARCE